MANHDEIFKRKNYYNDDINKLFIYNKNLY